MVGGLGSGAVGRSAGGCGSRGGGVDPSDLPGDSVTVLVIPVGDGDCSLFSYYFTHLGYRLHFDVAGVGGAPQSVSTV